MFFKRPSSRWMIFFILPLTSLPVSPPEHDRHAEHAGGSVREWSGVSFSPDQEKERRQGGQCVVIPDPLALFCSVLLCSPSALHRRLLCPRLYPTQVARSPSRLSASQRSSLLFYLPRCSLSERSDRPSSILSSASALTRITLMTTSFTFSLTHLSFKVLSRGLIYR